MTALGSSFHAQRGWWPLISTLSVVNAATNIYYILAFLNVYNCKNVNAKHETFLFQQRKQGTVSLLKCIQNKGAALLLSVSHKKSKN